MRINAIVITLTACICGVSVQASPLAADTQDTSLLQRNSDVSAAARRKPAQHKAVPAIPSFRHRGFADPSFGPDGRPYQVPEYLRGQCYFDDGYGRFVPCSNRS